MQLINNTSGVPVSTPVLKAVVLKVWAQDQQQRHLLRICENADSQTQTQNYQTEVSGVGAQ